MSEPDAESAAASEIQTELLRLAARLAGSKEVANLVTPLSTEVASLRAAHAALETKLVLAQERESRWLRERDDWLRRVAEAEVEARRREEELMAVRLALEVERKQLAEAEAKGRHREEEMAAVRSALEVERMLRKETEAALAEKTTRLTRQLEELDEETSERIREAERRARNKAERKAHRRADETEKQADRASLMLALEKAFRATSPTQFARAAEAVPAPRRHSKKKTWTGLRWE